LGDYLISQKIGSLCSKVSRRASFSSWGSFKAKKKRRSLKEFMMASAMPVNVLNHGDVNMDPVTFDYAFMQSQSDPF
jgi:hypothetical protein